MPPTHPNRAGRLEAVETESFEFLNELALAFRAAENHPRPACAPVLEGVRAVLTHLQSTGRLIPAVGMALTAEQVEDVRTVAWYTGAGLGRAPMAEIHRLRALFPATEAAEEVTQAEGFCSFCGWSRDACARGEGDCAPAEPAEDAKPCGSNSVTLGWCKLTARHEGLHTNGTYLWGTPSEPDPPAPAEPAEEETKAEGRDPDELAKRMALIWEGGWDEFDEKERDYLRCAAEIARAYYASSPVVPAPTETGPQTLEGPWDRIEDVPETVGRLTDRDGDIWEWDGDNWVTPETAILPTTYINKHYAPFVAAEGN